MFHFGKFCHYNTLYLSFCFIFLTFTCYFTAVWRYINFLILTVKVSKVEIVKIKIKTDGRKYKICIGLRQGSEPEKLHDPIVS